MRRLAAVSAALLALVLVLGYALGPDRAAGTRSSRSAAAAKLEPVRSAAPAISLAVGGDAPDTAPVILAVELEKQEVCAGEENLVTVHAAGAHLRTIVGGVPGQRLALVGLPDDEHPGMSLPVVVQVFGPDGAMSTAEVPPFRIADCVVPHRLTVSAEKRSNTDSEFQLDATILPFGEGAPFEAVRYRWDFGDGAIVETRAPSVVHDFADRPQDALYAYQLIAVEAVDAGGHTVVGRSTLELSNRYVENKELAHTIVLRSALSPRFAERDAHGVVRQQFRLWHHETAPVHIERVIEQTHFLPARADGEPPPPREREVAPEAVLTSAEVPAAGLDFELAIDARREPEVSFRSWRLEGQSAEGITVVTVISLMPPSPEPTADNHIAVDDVALKARIERALALLGKSTVTGEELAELERQGEFADLAPYNPTASYAPTARPVTPRPR